MVARFGVFLQKKKVNAVKREWERMGWINHEKRVSGVSATKSCRFTNVLQKGL